LASLEYIEKVIVVSIDIVDILTAKNQNLNRVQTDTMGQLREGVRGGLAVDQRK